MALVSFTTEFFSEKLKLRDLFNEKRHIGRAGKPSSYPIDYPLGYVVVKHSVQSMYATFPTNSAGMIFLRKLSTGRSQQNVKNIFFSKFLEPFCHKFVHLLCDVCSMDA